MELECVEGVESPLTIPLTFWFKPHSTFGLFSMTTFVSSSLMLPIPSFLAPLRLSAARIEVTSRFTLSASWLRATLSPELHTRPLPATHVRVRNYWHYNRSTLRLTIKWATSCRTSTLLPSRTPIRKPISLTLRWACHSKCLHEKIS